MQENITQDYIHGFAGSKRGTTTWLDQEAIDYANNLSNGSKAVDNTNKENIKVTPYEKDEKQYLRIGPFNWSFGGTITEVNEREKVVEIKFDDEKVAWYEFSELEEIEHSYAITIHKAQRK